MSHAVLDLSQTKTLTISWSFNDPPLAAAQWFTWSPELIHAIHAQAKDLTEAMLIKAFEQRLPRNMGWDLSLLPKTEQAIGQKAASLFRRGVATRTTGQTPQQTRKNGRYDVHIVTTDTLAPFISGTPFYIIDHNVRPHVPFDLGHAPQLVLELTEKSKDLQSVQKIRETYQALGKPSPWVIIGGGILGDVAACAAALEDVPFILVPTTLLAMVDACVGGKTGVNFPPFGKNQLGRFAFPETCVMWPGWLKSLPEREYKAGIAECLKHSLLSPKGLIFHPSKERTINPELLQQLIEVKAETVAQDPAEEGLRASLNLGHTLAHALEAKSHAVFTNPRDIILHGEAVAFGLVFALYVSHRAAGLPELHLNEGLKRLRESGCVGTVRDLENRVFGRVVDATTAFNELIPLLMLDKKTSSLAKDCLAMALLANLGQPNPGPAERYVIEVPLDEAHLAFHGFWHFIS